MTACVECGKDVCYLADLGVDPNVCGYCKKFMCPTCETHSECLPKIQKHNAKIDLKEAEVALKSAKTRVKDLRKKARA